MKKVNFLLVCSTAAALSFLSCKKGDIGPAGPAGAAGAAGTAGSTGATGATGATGTANVQYTDWFTPTPWVKDTVFGIWGFNYNKPIAAITQAVLDSGMVIVYGKLQGYNTLIWAAGQVGTLPIDLTYISGATMTDTWSAITSAGNVKIKFVNDKNYYTGISTSHQFRVVVIPGGIKTARLKELTYQEVCKLYNIAE